MGSISALSFQLFHCMGSLIIFWSLTSKTGSWLDWFSVKLGLQKDKLILWRFKPSRQPLGLQSRCLCLITDY